MPQMDDFLEDELLFGVLASFSGFIDEDEDEADLVDDDDELNVALINII